MSSTPVAVLIATPIVTAAASLGGVFLGLRETGRRDEQRWLRQERAAAYASLLTTLSSMFVACVHVRANRMAGFESLFRSSEQVLAAREVVRMHGSNDAQKASTAAGSALNALGGMFYKSDESDEVNTAAVDAAFTEASVCLEVLRRVVRRDLGRLEDD